MSLSSKIKGAKPEDKQFQEIIKAVLPEKPLYYTLSGKPAFSNQYEELVPYSLGNPYLASVVGTAFDYLARFIIARAIRTGAEQAFQHVAAFKGLERMESFADKKTMNALNEKCNDGLAKTIEYIYQDKADSLARIPSAYLPIVQKAQKIAYKKISAKNYSCPIAVKDLVPFSIFLAKLEQVTRSGMPPMDTRESMLGTDDPSVVHELICLCSVFQNVFIASGLISPDSTVIFNPTFGMVVSMCCGGADADIYIDGTLYDFKTGKVNQYKWQDAAQIVGYHMLNDVAEMIGEPAASLQDYPIWKLALYKARFGEIECVDLSDDYKERLWNAAKELAGFWNLRTI